MINKTETNKIQRPIADKSKETIKFSKVKIYRNFIYLNYRDVIYS